ncbi:lysylphosphatidylglycerol synthase transmembrane domain-containing protein [Kitasatospora cinereorecta]|uniref:Lysylphosphatidylglycerol synthase transmembrane domain-containing protein n=1 Tax=Kitasatospora cinereorecta TaxID=285560 RepID=A0ABW0VN12_9ACTN
MATVIQTEESDAASRKRPRPEDRRVRHPAALIRLLAGAGAIGVVLLLPLFARATAGGLDADITLGAELLPWPPVKLTAALCAAALLLVPLTTAVQRVLRGERRRVTDGVLAAVIAYGLSLGLDLLVGGMAALTHDSPAGHGRTDPVYGHLAPVLAFMTAVGATGVRRSRTVLATALALSGISGLVTGYATPLSVLLALLVGWTAAHATCYTVGEPFSRPTERQILLSLAQSGVRPVSVHPAGPGRYLATQRGDRPDLDVRLLDREAQANGLLWHLWLSLRLRTAPRPFGLRPLRAGLEHQALLAYAASAAGARTRTPVAVAELGSEAALVAYRHLVARPLGELTGQELTDEVLADAWRQLALLQRRRIAHRALDPQAVLVDGDGAVHLVDLAEGEIAASDLLLRLDVAGLLTVLALHAGAERAVAAAMAVLGPGPVGSALPLLQPIALPRATRAALKLRPDLPAELRAEVQRHLPQAPSEPVRLERLRPRTLVTVGAGMLAGYLLLQTLFSAERNPFAVLAEADPGWLAAAVAAAVASHLAATLGFVGFVPERLSFRSALAAQVAGGFVKLVSPGGVGGVALNTRFLQCAGIPTAQALSSVGVSQLLGLGLHLVQLAVFSSLLGLGTGAPMDELPSGWVLAVVLAGIGVLLLSVAAVPWLRRRIQALLRPLRAEVLPRLLDLLQQPRKLAAGVAGQLLVSMAFVVCLYCCARAIGTRPAFSGVAVTFLAGNAAGSAVPSPGGAGAVELLLTDLLAGAGPMDKSTAFAAVVLFRLLVFLLPVLPGWAAFAWLQRRKAL